MEPRHPALPDERPLAIAHRAGNSTALAEAAIAAGADLLETDVWRYRKRLEIRHIKTMGPVPLLWDRWELHPGWGPRLQLTGLVNHLAANQRLFLDLKGKDPELGTEIVATLHGLRPDHPVILCGRTWHQLDRVVDHPGVTVFYSVGSDDELAMVWERLTPMRNPAVSIHSRYVTPELMRRFKGIGATVVSWPIDTFDVARRLHDIGVDGFTSDNLELVRRISLLREKALDADVTSPVLRSARGEGE